MTAHDRETHGSGHPPAEEDIVPSARIVWVGVISLVVFLLGGLAAAAGLVAVQRSVNPDGPAATPSAAGQAKIGIVEQRLFANSNQGPVWREQALRRLESTGWADRQKGLVHVPIERAMERVERGERP